MGIGCDCILIELVAIPAQTILVHIPLPPTHHPSMQHRIMLQAAEETETDVTDRRPARGEEKKKGELLVAPLWRMTGTQQLCSLTHPFTHPPTSQPNNLHTHAHTHSHASTANFGNEVCQSEIELVADSATCQIRIVSRRPPIHPVSQ